jgi:hypothetical protein
MFCHAIKQPKQNHRSESVYLPLHHALPYLRLFEVASDLGPLHNYTLHEDTEYFQRSVIAHLLKDFER